MPNFKGVLPKNAKIAKIKNISLLFLIFELQSILIIKEYILYKEMKVLKTHIKHPNKTPYLY